MKKTATIVTVIIISLLLSGCGGTKKQKLKFFSEDILYSYEKYTDLVWNTENRKELDKGYQIKINTLCLDVCNFLNSKYNANWKAKEIKAYTNNVTEDLEKYITNQRYGALYYENSIYIDNDLFEKNDPVQMEYVISHELLHYLFDINAKVEAFALEKDNKNVGMYIEEAIVDQLAVNYTLNKYPDASKEELKSGYKYIRMYVNIAELGIPDFYSYFFKGDIKGLEKSFNNLVKKHVICVGNPFEKWLKVIDITYKYNNKDEILTQNVGNMIYLLASITPNEKGEEFLKRAREVIACDESLVELMY